VSANPLTEGRVLHIERVIAAPPERLFALWTEPEELAKWWGPEGFTTPKLAMDVRAGGRWRTTMRRADGTENTVSGIYRTIDPPRRVVFTWGWDDDAGLHGHETEVTVTLEPVPGGTRMVLTQQAFVDRDSRDRHAQGWTSSFVCLEREIVKSA
jgi:uncharacterized protein YndB with AHSA1/START domain